MNRGIRSITRLLICLTAAGAMTLPAFAQDTACGKPMTEAQKVERAFDYMEIRNVASEHEYYHGAWDHRAEFNNIWSKRDDITWKNNTDYYIGRKAMWRFYVLNAESLPKKGVLAYHMMTTPVIQIAGDGKTAKGIFMSFGNVTGPMGPGGKAQAVWTEEKYGIDFIKEDGQWKIWHLRTYVEFYSPINKSWADAANNLNAPKNTGQAGAGAPPPPPGGKLKAGVKEEPGSKFGNLAAPTEKGNYYEGYTINRMPQFNPKPPAPYCHFSETTPF